ncbi:hypothetical protein LPJ53_003512 [Coemansia erecta]|uniref:F-box domain-containing protein n=1 Tax=Coemansia erecta TaxID=147472 RepID=A0A9W7XZX7_9FUNG|nr:hypothetical protein LPJ53_003512 [Coemansia erecta]
MTLSPKLLLLKKMWKMSWIKGGSQSPPAHQQEPDRQSSGIPSAGNSNRSNGGEPHANAMLMPGSAIERTHTWSGAASGATAYTPTSPLAMASLPASNTPRSFMVPPSVSLSSSVATGSGFVIPSAGISPPVSPCSRPGGMKRKDSFVSTNGRSTAAAASILSSTFADGRLDFLTYLPYEIAMVIVIYADFPAIATIAEVSRSWNRFARDNAVWRRLFLQQTEWRTPRALASAGRTSSGRRRLGHRSAANGTGNAGGNLGTSGFGVTTPSSSVCTSGANTPRVGDEMSGYGPEAATVNGAQQILSAYTGSSLRPAIALQHMVAPSPVIGSIGPPRSNSDLGRQPGALNWSYLFRQRLALDSHWTKGIAEVNTVTGHADSVYCVQYDREKIVTGSRDRTIKIWDSQTLQCVRTMTGHEASVLCLKYDRTTMVTGSSDSTVIIWDMATGAPLQRLLSHTAGVLDVAFNDECIVSCSKDCTIKVWDRSSGRLLRTLVGHRGPVNAVQLHGNRVVSASGDSLIKLWDLKTGELIRTFSGHTRGLACVQYDGKTIVSGSSDQLIKVWDAESGHCMQTLRGHKDLVRTLHFTGGRRAVSGSYDQTIKVWDIVSGECTLDIKDVHTSWVFDVQFSTSRIVSTSQDQKIIIWDFGKGLDISDFD